MTYTLSTPLAIPLSALLPPQTPKLPSTSTVILPSPSLAILGPLPPTTPVHLALNYLALSELPEYAYDPLIKDQRSVDRKGKGREIIDDKEEEEVGGNKVDAKQGGGGGGGGGGEREGGRDDYRRDRAERAERAERVLIITTSRQNLFKSLQEDDEDWMRDNTFSYDIINRLKRIDIRYCPSVQNLQLLLSLLCSGQIIDDKQSDIFNFRDPPSLIILWDIGSLLMEMQAGNENVNPEQEAMTIEDNHEARGSGEEKASHASRLVMKPNVIISDYLDLISAAKQMRSHLSKFNPNSRPIELAIFEPNLNPDSSLPVLAPKVPSDSNSEGLNGESGVSAGIRGRRIKMLDGLRWMLGDDALGAVVEIPSELNNPYDPTFELILSSDPQTSHKLRKRRCDLSPWNKTLMDGTSGKSGWRWEWY